MELDVRKSDLTFANSAGNQIRGVLILADDMGEYPARFAAGGEGVAGNWTLRFEARDWGNLLALDVLVHPGEAELDFVTLRLFAGQGNLPLLQDPQSRALIMGGGNAEKPEGCLPLYEALEARPAAVLVHPQHPATLLGLGGPADDPMSVSLDKDVEITFSVERPLANVTRFRFVVGIDPNPFRLLESYGDLLARFARPASAPLTGWNSWDYYGGAVSMEDVRREMAAIRAVGLQDKLKAITLDMGWEHAWGEWEPNHRFPASYREIAREIEEAGFLPGIWLAPLQAHMYSQLGRKRQDLLVRDSQGALRIGENTILDFSLTEVQDILRDWFGRLREAGFRIFKLDYIYDDYVALLNHCSDPASGRVAIIRRGLEVIRAAAGEDSHLINCGGPFEAALGIADSSRATTDIHTFWGHIRHNAGQLAARLWQNERLWRVDADFALIRCAETTEDAYPNPVYRRRPLEFGQGHWLAGPEASLGELRVWLSLVRLSGGSVFLSDSIARLNADGIDMLKKLFPPLPCAATPLDLFHGGLPRYWFAQNATGNLLGIFNWADEPRPVLADSAPSLPDSGRDVWTGQTIHLRKDAEMPAHSVLLLEC